MNKRISWADENLKLLENLYPKHGYKAIQKYFPQLKKKCIVEAARRHGIKKINHRNNKYKLEFLLKKTNLNYYWIGFLMADGNLDLKKNRLRISLGIKDIEHLDEFAKLCGVNTKIQKSNGKNSFKSNSNFCRLEVTDSENIKKIIKQYDFKYLKTYNPPKIDYLKKDDNFLSFLSGFIDGDGCISTTKNGQPHFIRIQCHASWISVFDFFETYLFNNFNINSRSFINTKGFAELYIGKKYQLLLLKNKIQKLKLPLLKRKWNKIK